MPGAGELDAEEHRVLDVGSARRSTSSREEPAADRPVRSDLRAHRPVDLERQAQPVLARAAVAVGAGVPPREERRHRVGVGVVQLDAVEARAPRPRRGRGEQPGQHPRQLGDVRQVDVGHPLPVSVGQRLELARR